MPRTEHRYKEHPYKKTFGTGVMRMCGQGHCTESHKYKALDNVYAQLVVADETDAAPEERLED